MADSSLSRRGFMQTAAVGTTALVTAPARAAGANGRLRIGLIGTGRRGFGTHVKSLVALHKLGSKIDLAAVCDVYTVHRDQAVEYVKEHTGLTPKTYADYRDMLQADDIDAVCIATPDHWHAKQILDALAAGKHVYCEKPMTHTTDEAAEVVAAWKSSGLVVQVGVQSSSSPIWDMARERINDGQLGKIVQFQTESFRNSLAGMSRHNVITKEMTPKNIDWKRWLGYEEGLGPKMIFDRAVYGQWRCYWPYGYGMYSDLFVHRVTGMLKATGLRYPGRVVGGGGIFLEYDDRDMPDVASLIADFHEGVQGLVSSTMVAEEMKIEHLIRGHHGVIQFQKESYGNGPKASYDFLPERPQVTLDNSLKKEHVEAKTDHNFNVMHFDNFIKAIETGKPNSVNNDPELGAAAVMIVNLAVRSYREGRVFHIDRNQKITNGNSSWADGWESMSEAKAAPRHVPGWQAGERGSTLVPFDYQTLAGPWVDGRDPAESQS